MRRLVLAGIALCLAAGGAALGWWLSKPEFNAQLYGQLRLVSVQAQLDEAKPGYILIAGDSQAEMHNPSGPLCGAEIVNAGTGGATAEAYARLLPQLKLDPKPGAAILTIGSNDLNRKHKPNSEASARAFGEAVSRIVLLLRQATPRVVVTAVPPIGRSVGDRLEASAVGPYSRVIREACERLGCLYADPFAALRDGDSGFALKGALRDGLHLARFRPVQAALAPLLCGAGENGPSTNVR
ncbi:SGNH/GDSL hydrolase family protein [Methylobacterium organophilum]|uniref:SGNH/GDSL hydrolase family protein n=1 Tax=Methylobacterium organophilum TaxID=410 RepID=UPI001F148B39|nr:SGNH/GDSL hydrolase family protein [Methylobacterium organophilum]UMY15978.1 SGNH/GDSL hydrolase family protein [Methylobacterium organophilum]